MFRKIYANSTIFQDTKNRYENIYYDFKNFSVLETINSGKSQNNKSNKAGSYANYLIRLIVFYEEKYPSEYSTFTSYEDFTKLKLMTLNKEFDIYNKKENHFPSASLNAFERYIKFRINFNQTNQLEINYNFDQTNSEGKFNQFIVKEHTVTYETARKSKINYNGISLYPRNLNESILAKQRSKWKCEYNTEHQTFKSSKDNNPYMEAHHLIPMSYQYFFENSIDFADNIICLCPTCHRKIHNAHKEVKREMIIKLFNQRKLTYPAHGINIDIQSLLSMYKI